MSFDLAADAAVASDLAGATTNPTAAFLAAITLYRCFGAVKGASGLAGYASALDKAGLLLAAVEADITLAPVIKTVLADPVKKARFFAFLATL